MRRAFLATLLLAGGCRPSSDDGAGPLYRPPCTRPPHARTDAHAPEVIAADWGPPVRLGDPANTRCPEDAAGISPDGKTLFFMFTTDLLGNLPYPDVVSFPNGTYASRDLGEGRYSWPVFYDLGKGIDQSLDGAPSFTADGLRVFFHSLRATNTGWLQDPPVDDPDDLYAADVVNGEPGPGVNLGPAVNSPFIDAEPAIHPDGVTLWFASNRPGGSGGADLWSTTWTGSAWTAPTPVAALNTPFYESQPCFTPDGNTVYFASDRDAAIGMAIYRSTWTGSAWGTPELVVRGIVGEPAISPDGKTLYFVHVLSDAAGSFDADLYVSVRP
jgi:Tol biopolymer transport system component